MPVSPCFKPVHIRPLTGPLDTRSSADQVPVGAWRWRLNWDITAAGKLCRGQGFERFLGDAETYNNQDLHDQLLDLQYYYDELATPDSRGSTVSSYPPPADICGTVQKLRDTGERQPFTYLYESLSVDGQRKLLAGTQNRLYALNESRGNWKIVSDKYGGSPKEGLPEIRWKSAQVGNIVVLTNGFDPVQYWTFDGPTQGCQMQSIAPIDDLGLIGLTQAGVVFAWKGITFLGDVTMDGIRIPHMVVWSDVDAPLSFDPAASGTVAGQQPLLNGERIMAFSAVNDFLLIYTTRGIWQVSVVGSDQVLNFRQLYSESQTGEACIIYPNTLVSTGQDMIYLGRDGIYVFNLYLAKPERVEWIHRASSIIFNGIDGMFPGIRDTVCQAHFGFYDPKTETVFFSWVNRDNTFPTHTLALNLRYQFASVLDHGMTAATVVTPNSNPSVRDFLTQFAAGKCICTTAELESEELEDLLSGDVKEGGYCTEPAAQSCAGVSRTAPIYTDQVTELDGKLIEDYTQTSPSAGSLCSAFGDLTIEDFCAQCETEQRVVFAHPEDFCLKQLGVGVYSREICVGFDACGEYETGGYDSLLMSGPMSFELPEDEKAVRLLELEFDAEAQTVPSNMEARFGWSPNGLDPLEASGMCAIHWWPLTPKPLKCLSGASAAGHATAKTSANRVLSWPFLLNGRHLYIEMKIAGIGGAACFSRLSLDVRAKPRSVTS